MKKELQDLILTFSLVAIGFVVTPLHSRAQENTSGSSNPVVSPTALDSVSAPVKTPPSVPAYASGEKGKSGKIDEATPSFPGKTELDEPGLHEPALGTASDLDRLSKIDLDSDLNYDGTIDNSEPSDQRANESTPPGLELGKGELTRVVLRLKTYERDFTGDLVVTVSATGINRDTPTGEAAAGTSVGRVKIWKDQARTTLLADSGDPSKSSHEWVFNRETRTGGVPSTLYIEGVSVSPKHEGDVRILVSATHGAPGAPSSVYRAAYDHLLVTVREKPVEKSFVNNNIEGIWSTVGGQ